VDQLTPREIWVGSDEVMEEIVISSGWRDTLRDLAARRKDSWPLLLLVGAVALLAVVIGGGDAPARIAPPATAGGPVAPSPTPEDPGAVLVHVAGAVRRPGLYEFPSNARVADAVETAGGPTARADLDALNLAEPLVDGTKIHVSKRGEQPPAASTGSGAATGESSPSIALNAADQTQLETIPGIGPVTALAILEYRDEIGRFESIDQLLDVNGIGPATLEDIRPYLSL
jgi:competence protein ComEA